MQSTPVKLVGTLLAAGAIIAAMVHAATDAVSKGLLDYAVDPPLRIPALETSYLYALLMGFSFFSVFFLSFDSKVAYARKWKFLLPGILLVGLPFIMWDVQFTAWEVWGFNSRYYSGWKIMGLPIEEWLFFAVIPFACAFIYENIRVKLGNKLPHRLETWISPLLILGFLTLGILAWGKSYSAITYLLTGGVYLLHYLYGAAVFRARFLLSFAWSFIPFLLVDGGLTGIATEQPIVVYNPEEFYGWRMWTVPVDDAVYGFLLLFGVIGIYEWGWNRDQLRRKPA
jgi:lycopene cyclase domain-containing protein